MAKIKIANIIEDGRLAGPQLRITEVCRLLDKNEFDTTVLVPAVDNEGFLARLKLYGVKYKVLPMHRLTKNAAHLLGFVIFFWYEIFRVYRYLKEEGFHIVHVSGGSWQWKGVIAGKLAGCQVIWHLNDTSVPLSIRLVFGFLARKLVDGFIVAGNKVKTFYLDGLFRDKVDVIVIQAPVDCNKFNPEKKRGRRLRHTEKMKIVSVTNINPLKGIEVFIRAAAEANKLGIDAEFFVVGPVYDSQRAYFATLEELVAMLGLDNFNFYGQSTDIVGILEWTDIYVCSSNAEASPMSVWEALAMGIPLVSTAVGDVPYLVSDGRSGFLTEVGDYSVMARRIFELSRSVELRSSFGYEGRSIAMEHLDTSICVEKHEQFYRRIFQNP